MNNSTTTSEQVTGNFIDAIGKHARSAGIAGVVMIICGILAVAAPLAAGISITIIVGVLLAGGGIAQCLLAFRVGALGQGLLIFVIGLLTTVAGFFMLSQPLEGLAAITIFLAIYFVLTGLFELIAAMQLRPISGWGWLLFNGFVTLLLGAIIWRQFPVSGVWAVGILFGIKLMMSGWWLVVVGRSVRVATKPV